MASCPRHARLPKTYDQLGFRLNSRKSLVEVIVVDHVEMIPTEN
jgi:uncharacterized protein (TIGR03435 family)